MRHGDVRQPLRGVYVGTHLADTLDLRCRIVGRIARPHDVITELVDPRLESPRESWSLLAILDAGLPAPQPQHWVEVDGRPTYLLDLAYPRRRVCVEYDGDEWHASDEQREHDRVRRRWLRDHGWTVIVLREGDFSGERLDRWLDELRKALQPAYSNRRW